MSYQKGLADVLQTLASFEYQKNEWSNENIGKTWFFPTEIYSAWIQDFSIENLNIFLDHGSITQENFNNLIKNNIKIINNFKIMLEKDEINKEEYYYIEKVDKAMRNFANINNNNIDLKKEVEGLDLLSYQPWLDVVHSSQECIDGLKKLGWTFESIPDDNWTGKAEDKMK